MGYFPSSQLLIFIPKSSSSSSKRRTKGSLKENLKESLLDDEGGRAEAAVPKGFLAVYVGQEAKRFVIPTRYLCLPSFEGLMDKAAEEFGFQQTGGLRIPCDEDYFRQIIEILDESEAERKAVSKKKKKNNNNKKKNAHTSVKKFS